jgi:DNA-binding beta-propeller fold protein YncE
MKTIKYRCCPMSRVRSFAITCGLFASLVCLPNVFAQSAEPVSSEVQAKWSTPWAKGADIVLEYSFDSSGPDAWNPEEHPTVFITTEGPGYGGLMSGVTLPGLVIIDADSRKVIASNTYDVLGWGWKSVFEPHGLGVSPDGKWIYLPTGEGATMTIGDHAGRYLVINARTLKLDKVIKIRGQAHHASSYTTPEGEQRVMIYGWSQPLFVLDPEDDNKVVGAVSLQDQGIEAYTYFASLDGDRIIGTGRFRDRDLRQTKMDNTIMFIDPETWKVDQWLKINDSEPTMMAFSSDNKFAYLGGARHSVVMKLDLEQNQIVGETRAGVDGPYGVHLGWDDRIIYSIGKGEGSHNRGKMIGLLDSIVMTTPGSIPMEQFYTGCTRGDHGTLHPDPDANEMWITCNSSFEVVVFDLDLKEVVDRISTPHGGSTHSGAFVQYDNGWTGPGETVSDQNGLHGRALETKRMLNGS